MKILNHYKLYARNKPLVVYEVPQFLIHGGYEKAGEYEHTMKNN